MIYWVFNCLRFILPLYFVYVAWAKFAEGKYTSAIVILLCAVGLVFLSWRSLAKEKRDDEERK